MAEQGDANMTNKIVGKLVLTLRETVFGDAVMRDGTEYRYSNSYADAEQLNASLEALHAMGVDAIGDSQPYGHASLVNIDSLTADPQLNSEILAIAVHIAHINRKVKLYRNMAYNSQAGRHS
jgi:hypothetical protein